MNMDMSRVKLLSYHTVILHEHREDENTVRTHELFIHH